MQHPIVAAIQRELDAARSEVTETRKALTVAAERIAELTARNRILNRDIIVAEHDAADALDRESGAWAARAALEAPRPTQEALLPVAVTEPTSRTVARARHEGMA